MSTLSRGYNEGDAERISHLEAENKILREYALAATKAITGLTTGGSEYFAKEVSGVFLADLPRCLANIEQRRESFAKLRELKAIDVAACVAVDYANRDYGMPEEKVAELGVYRFVKNGSIKQLKETA